MKLIYHHLHIVILRYPGNGDERLHLWDKVSFLPLPPLLLVQTLGGSATPQHAALVFLVKHGNVPCDYGCDWGHVSYTVYAGRRPELSPPPFPQKTIFEHTCLLSHHRQHRQQDTIKLVEASPKSALTQALEDLGAVGVFLLVRTVCDNLYLHHEEHVSKSKLREQVHAS